MFLQVITRTMGNRPQMLARNQSSLAAQSDNSWAQTLVVDRECRGCGWANRNLSTIPALGQWVWILDDDDECILPTFVEGLRRIAERHTPDVIMVRMDHGAWGILPDDAVWGREPQLGRIGMSAFVVRGDVWERTRAQWREVYEADFHYIHGLWATPGVRMHWWNVTVSRVQRFNSHGTPEHETTALDPRSWEQR